MTIARLGRFRWWATATMAAALSICAWSSPATGRGRGGGGGGAGGAGGGAGGGAPGAGRGSGRTEMPGTRGRVLGGISVGWLTTDQAASGHERTPSVPPTGLADGFGREDWPYHRHACGFTPVGHGSPARTYDSAGPHPWPPSSGSDR